MQSPMASNTTFIMLYNTIGSSCSFRANKFVRSKISQLSIIIASVTREHSAEIRTEVKVKQIVVDEYHAKSIVLANSEEFSAQTIISNANPLNTFFDLVKTPNLRPQFNQIIKNIRFRSTTAKMNLTLSNLPKFKRVSNPESQLSGHIVICPSLKYLERTYDNAKYGSFSKQPYLDIVILSMLDSTLTPENQHVMSITMQYAPYHLKSND